MKTPPGTKVCLVGTVRLSSGIILLDSKNIQILGGEVPELIEEWKIQQVGFIPLIHNKLLLSPKVLTYICVDYFIFSCCLTT